MLYAYETAPHGLARLASDAPLSGAIWLDLYRPLDPQVEAVGALGVTVPSVEEMEEIEISSRLYRENGSDYMTVTLPGQSLEKTQVSGPVTLIVSPERLVTVRHHAPRSFELFPDRAGRSALGSTSVERVFLGLTDEIVARFADLLEAAGRKLDELSTTVFSGKPEEHRERLRDVLQEIGRQGEMLGRVRHGLLTMERALSFFGQTIGERADSAVLSDNIKAQLRDIGALGVHVDFLSNRISLIDDATLGMINLDQNANVRIFSVVAVLFMPPTLVASVYGMNFRFMPELTLPWGYGMALGLMVLSAAASYLFFKWKKWL
jgi:magnesium transporter